MLEIQDVFGNFRKVRALIDSGSQVSFIVANLVRQLGLLINTSSVPIIGIGNHTSVSSHGTARYHSHPLAFSSPPIFIDAFILSNICSQLLSVIVDPRAIDHVGNVTLTDITWNIPGKDDRLGADIYPTLFKDGIIHGSKNKPTAINTIFGWLLVGPITSTSPVGPNSFFVSTEPLSNIILRKFWKIEKVPKKSETSSEDQ